MNSKEISVAAGSLILNALQVGALTFVSAVSVPTLLRLLSENRIDALKEFFKIWWPNGRNYMVPLSALATTSYLATYYLTSNLIWLLPAGATFFVLPYTALVMGEDISSLRDGNEAALASSTKRFCMLHHLRVVVTGAGLAFGLFHFLKAKRQ